MYGRQLLVALHEATENAAFRDIIAHEFERLFPIEAKLLYLDICSLHRFGQPVRAGLISRVHGIDFEEFNAKFFKPLEQVIDLARDLKSQDWIYRARHPVIASMVYELGLPNVQEKYDNLVRIISKLNPSYSYDREVLFELVRASKLAEIFRDRTLGTTIYETAQKALGETDFLLHQQGIYEMRLAGDMVSLDRAGRYLDRALNISNGNPSIKHSLAELDLKRATIAVDPSEKEAWKRSAESQSLSLTKNSKSSHPFHTLAKAALVGVKDALDKVEVDDGDLTQEALGQAIKKAEDVLREGMQRFPNDDHLLNEEATLAEILQNADRSLAALKKAFRSNPRSELISRRLARILLAKGQTAEAIEILRQALDLNPGSQILHFDLARAIMSRSPDADTVEKDVVLYHLQRSVTPGDKNHQGRFWLARQFFLCGKEPEAKQLFDALKKLSLPFRQRRGVRGMVRSASGGYTEYFGQVCARRPLFGFVKADEDSSEAYFGDEHVEGSIDAMEVGQRVTYHLGFSLAGPVALRVRKIL